jgi:hypothetical protein
MSGGNNHALASSRGYTARLFAEHQKVGAVPVNRMCARAGPWRMIKVPVPLTARVELS